MVANSLKRISWFFALSLIWRRQAFLLGRRHLLISLWMRFAVLLLVMAPVMTYLDSLTYSGAMPPEAPMVKAVGTFTTAGNGVGRNPGIVFNTVTGMKFYTAHRVAPGVLMQLAALNPPVKVYVKGFVLQDGNGSFYPLKIASPSGVDLAAPDKLMAELQVGRNPFHVQRLKSLAFVLVIPWGSLFFYAWKLREQLAKQERIWSKRD